MNGCPRQNPAYGRLFLSPPDKRGLSPDLPNGVRPGVYPLILYQSISYVGFIEFSCFWSAAPVFPGAGGPLSLCCRALATIF